MVIIYDNEITSSPNIIMSNDGHGHLIDIPSVFISNADGEKILNAFKCSNSMILKIHFDVFASKIADVTFWLDVNNRESFITLRDFYRDYHKAISNYVNYDVKFKVNKNCGRNQCNYQDCVRGQELCLVPGTFVNGAIKREGKDIIYEHVRSYYVFQTFK